MVVAEAEEKLKDEEEVLQDDGYYDNELTEVYGDDGWHTRTCR